MSNNFNLEFLDLYLYGNFIDTFDGLENFLVNNVKLEEIKISLGGNNVTGVAALEKFLQFNENLKYF